MSSIEIQLCFARGQRYLSKHQIFVADIAFRVIVWSHDYHYFAELTVIIHKSKVILINICNQESNLIYKSQTKYTDTWKYNYLISWIQSNNRMNDNIIKRDNISWVKLIKLIVGLIMIDIGYTGLWFEIKLC